MLFSPSTTLTSSSSLTSLSSSSSLSPSSSPSLLLFYHRLCHQPHYYSYYHGYCSSSKKVATASMDFLVLVTMILFQTKRAPQVPIKNTKLVAPTLQKRSWRYVSRQPLCHAECGTLLRMLSVVWVALTRPWHVPSMIPVPSKDRKVYKRAISDPWLSFIEQMNFMWWLEQSRNQAR